MPAIRLDAVSVRQGGVDILRDVSTEVEPRSITAIIGPNGAGKTTLLRAILGVVPYRGRILFGEKKTRRPVIGYVPQRLDFDRGLPMTVQDLLVMGIQRTPIWTGHRRSSVLNAEQVLRRVEASHLIRRPVGRLSGGELQRVQLALALQLEPEILLLDEPVSGVDVVGEKLFCDLLEQVKEESKLTMVMVSHDLSVVSQHATHVICLNHGLVAAGTRQDVLTPGVLSGLFGPHMVFGHVHGATAHDPCHSHAHPHQEPTDGNRD